MHPISRRGILFHSDRVADWTPARCGMPNIRFKSFGLCANAVDVPANMKAGATIPNHLDTGFLPSLRPRCYVTGIKAAFQTRCIFKRHFAFSGVVGLLQETLSRSLPHTPLIASDRQH
jgi:hypothetical protein